LIGLAALGLAARAEAAQAGYADSVDRALAIVQQASGDDRQAAHRAAAELAAGTADTQPEILSDLDRDPPDLADARARLTALSHAARSPAFTPEPGRARRALAEVLAQPRYAGLHAGLSPGERLQYLLLGVLVWLLQNIGGAGGVGFLVLAAAAALAFLAVGFFLVRASRGKGRREARLSASHAPEPVRDRFAEADRLAERGDLAGAVRVLAGAVAAALGEEGDWERSPLTVREIFGRAPEPAGLRPLLLAFEAAAYGARPPDRESYALAAAAAHIFRPEPRGAAA
jgi:hypothetical protein